MQKNKTTLEWQQSQMRNTDYLAVTPLKSPTPCKIFSDKKFSTLFFFLTSNLNLSPSLCTVGGGRELCCILCAVRRTSQGCGQRGSAGPGARESGWAAEE